MNSANSRFEAMAELSTRMVAAARANDWDLLAELEQQLGELRTAQQAAPEQTLNAETASRRLALIEQMQADQALVLEHVQPWMDSTRKLLSSQSKSRAVNKAYSAGF